jgi:SOS-response transcriptional repressor LexA
MESQPTIVNNSTLEITERQRAVLAGIAAFIRTNHFAPTVAEVSANIGVPSWVINRELGALMALGFLAYTPGKHRSFRVLREVAS